VIAGSPDQAHISTRMIERQNLTTRMSMRRFTWLTNAFSKKVENLRAAVSLHFAHYNFVRVHRSLRVIPAMEARVSVRLWSLVSWSSGLLCEARWRSVSFISKVPMAALSAVLRSRMMEP
jgi:hypothetical protein